MPGASVAGPWVQMIFVFFNMIMPPNVVKLIDADIIQCFAVDGKKIFSPVHTMKVAAFDRGRG